MTEQSPLATGLAAEHAAIYAYGPIGARLDGEPAELARAAEAAHRQRRDALLLHLASRGLATPAAAPAYALPFDVADSAAALRLAIHIEERTAGVWRSLLGHTEAEDRRTALDAFVDCAVRAAGWRAAAGVSPVTQVFPGLL